MHVRVHRNLIRDDWSVRSHHQPVVHLVEVTLADVRFQVSEASRLRMVAARCREVHAWAIGEIIDFAPSGLPRTPITYNPYRAGCFTLTDRITPILACEYAEFNSAGAFAVGNFTTIGDEYGLE